MKGYKKKIAVKVLAAALAVPMAFTFPSIASAGGLFGNLFHGVPQEDGNRYTVHAESTDYGRVSFADESIPTQTSVEGDFAEGETVAVAAGPTANGYLEAIQVETGDGTQLEYGVDEDGNISFTMPAQDVEVSLVYEMDPEWLEDVTIVENHPEEFPEGTKVITAFDTCYDGSAAVANDKSFDEILGLLPEEVSVTLENGKEEKIPATWECSMEDAYRESPEDLNSLAFVAKIPDGYAMNPNDTELLLPTVILKLADPYGVSTMAVTSGYLEKGGRISYGGWSTRRYTFNGREAYCGNPSADSPESGTYSVTRNYNSQIAAALWYGYGGPGFTPLMWPSKWYDGTAMTADRYRALTHIIVADIYSNDGAYAYGQCDQDFRQWVSYHIVGYGGYGAAVNTTAVERLIREKQWGYTDAYNTWPAGFNVYEIYTGAGNQFMLAFDYDGTENPAYSSLSYTARDAISPYLDLHIEKKDAKSGEYLAGAEFTIYMDGNEVTTVTSGQDGKASYHWRGGTLYTPYRTSSSKRYCINYSKLNAENQRAVNNNASVFNTSNDAYASAQNEVLSRVSSDLTALRGSTKHTWKVVETKAPKGYELNTKVWEQTLDSNTTAIEVDFTNVPKDAPVKIKKTSGNETLTQGNPCYSLEGAKYAFYRTYEDALNDTNREAVVTTNADGETEEFAAELDMTWYVREVEASPGYLLCDGSTNDGAVAENGIGIHEIYVEDPDVTYTVECADPPADDPFQLQLQKMDADTDSDAQGISSTQGAIFEVTYFTNTEGRTNGSPVDTWYFQTDEDGKLDCSKEDYLVESHTMDDGTVLESDGLYKNIYGRVAYPIGTYRIREVSAPQYFELEGTMHYDQNPGHTVSVTDGLTLVIRQDENGTDPVLYDGSDLVDGKITAENIAVSAYDDVRRGKIRLVKYGDDGVTPVEGAEFKLVGQEEGDVHTAKTDKNGRIEWTDLLPQHYTLTEVSTGKEWSLLADNIDITLPVSMTEAEARENGADLSKAVFDEATGEYCFYEQTIEVGEDVKLDFPMTGGDNSIMLPVLVGAFGAVAAGIVLLMRRKKKTAIQALPGCIRSE